jgi:hypothetical protein
MATTDSHQVKTGLHDLATKIYTLAIGLQTNSPPQGDGKPVNAVQYLLEAAMQLEQFNRAVDERVSSHPSLRK